MTMKLINMSQTKIITFLNSKYVQKLLITSRKLIVHIRAPTSRSRLECRMLMTVSFKQINICLSFNEQDAVSVYTKHQSKFNDYNKTTFCKLNFLYNFTPAEAENCKLPLFRLVKLVTTFRGSFNHSVNSHHCNSSCEK